MSEWFSAQELIAVFGAVVDILRTTVLVGAVALALLVVRPSAAFSHRVWFLVLVAGAILGAVPPQDWLPAIEIATPSWLGESVGGAVAISLTSAPYDRPSVALILLWISGTLFFLNRIIRDSIQVHRLMSRERTTPWRGDPVPIPVDRIRLSSAITLPAVGGLWRPKVLVPHAMLAWETSRRNAVLVHELAHIQRRDPLMLLMARLLCAVFWFNPLFWIIERRLRIEMERACDEAVVRAGFDPLAYARHLVDLATEYSAAAPLPATGIGSAGFMLKRRVAALLASPLRRRFPLVTVLAVALATMAPALIALSLSPSSTKLVFLPVKNGTLVVKGRERNLVLDMWPTSLTVNRDGRRSLELYSINHVRQLRVANRPTDGH